MCTNKKKNIKFNATRVSKRKTLIYFWVNLLFEWKRIQYRMRNII